MPAYPSLQTIWLRYAPVPLPIKDRSKRGTQYPVLRQGLDHHAFLWQALRPALATDILPICQGKWQGGTAELRPRLNVEMQMWLR